MWLSGLLGYGSGAVSDSGRYPAGALSGESVGVAVAMRGLALAAIVKQAVEEEKPAERV